MLRVPEATAAEERAQHFDVERRAAMCFMVTRWQVEWMLHARLTTPSYWPVACKRAGRMPRYDFEELRITRGIRDLISMSRKDDTKADVFVATLTGNAARGRVTIAEGPHDEVASKVDDFVEVLTAVYLRIKTGGPSW